MTRQYHDKDGFYDGYPMWLQDEIKARQEDPEPDCLPIYVQIGFLTPSGEQKSFRWFTLSKNMRGLCLEDYGRAVRALEDRNNIILPKSRLVKQLADGMNEADLSKIRQYTDKGKRGEGASPRQRAWNQEFSK